MNLELTDVQESFQQTARKFLEAETPLGVVRDLYDSATGFDPAWWRDAAALGWTSLFVPESLGGGSMSDGGARDAVIVAEEMGRLVSPGPFGPVSIVCAALSWAGSADHHVLGRLLRGESIATWAFAEAGGRWSSARLDTTVVTDGDSVVVDGTKSYVEAAAVADHFLVTGRTGDGVTQVLVPVTTTGVTVTPGRSVDITRRFGRVTFQHVRLPSAAVVGSVGGAADAVERQLQLALALQCAELVGVADKTLEFTLGYGADRYAFGRPIVSFQALKHRIADMTVWMEGSKAVSDALAAAIDERSSDAGLMARTAKAYIGEHCPQIVDECVQITGGIGVTWEHDIHLFNRRALLDRAVYGTPEEHKLAVYELIGGRS
ncbi:MAG: acyl-CoA dehydrogenase family protein [Acidimicrobiales bacterium]